MGSTLYHGDCRVVFQSLDRSNRRAIPANSIDLVATDPPYFIDGMGDDWSHRRLQARKARSGVVKGLPVGMKFDRRQSRRLYDFFPSGGGVLLRCAEAGGVYVRFCPGAAVSRRGDGGG